MIAAALCLLQVEPAGFGGEVRGEHYAFSEPACWFRSPALIIRVAVSLNAARKSKLKAQQP